MRNSYRFLPFLFALVLTGCALPPHAQPDMSAPTMAAENLAGLQHQQQLRPGDIEVTAALELRRQDYVRAEFREAERAVALNHESQAIRHLTNILVVEPGNFKAQQDIERLNRRQQMQADLERARRWRYQRPQEALDILSKMLAEQPAHAEAKRLRDDILRAIEADRPMQPLLAQSLRKPVSLNFKSQQLSAIFEAISRLSGVNFVFDRDVDINRSASLFAKKNDSRKRDCAAVAHQPVGAESA